METLPAEMQMMFTTEAEYQNEMEQDEHDKIHLEEVCEESYPGTQRTGTAGVSK